MVRPVSGVALSGAVVVSVPLAATQMVQPAGQVPITKVVPAGRTPVTCMVSDFPDSPVKSA